MIPAVPDKKPSPLTEVADTFGFLLGKWSIERVITDFQSGLVGRFHGIGNLRAPDPDGVPTRERRATYHEEGEFEFGSYLGTARRSLDYVQGDDSTILINFRDGRRFVDCNLRTGFWRAQHPCGDDRYELTFYVRSAQTFDEHWRVRGPTTDYVAHTILRRLEE